MPWIVLAIGVGMSLASLGVALWVGQVLWARRGRRRLLEDRWTVLGEELGLRYRGPKATTTGAAARRYGGPLGGREVALTILPRPMAQDWTLRLGLLRANLPEELLLQGPYLRHVGVELLRLRPGRLDERDLGLDRVPGHAGPYLGPVLRLHGGRQVELELSSVLVGQELATLRAAQELMSQLEAAIDRGWVEAGERLGLSAGLALDGHPPELSGQLDGCELRARVHRSEPAWLPGGTQRLEPQTWTEIVVRWSHPRLPDLEVALPGNLPAEQALDVPVLDMLVVVQCRDRAAAQELLGRAEVAEALLAVVHGHPGSRVLPGQVRLRTRGEPGPRTEALLVEASRLARLLSEG